MEDIENTFGSYTKTYFERDLARLCIYDRLCVEIDLSKDLLYKMILKWKKIDGKGLGL
jgi:hypothetical protein